MKVPTFYAFMPEGADSAEGLEPASMVPLPVLRNTLYRLIHETILWRVSSAVLTSNYPILLYLFLS